MARLVDANLIIRFLLNDTPEQAKAVENLFANSKDLVLNDLTIAETVWVLSSVYKFSRGDITQKLIALLSLDSFLANNTLLIDSLLIYQSSTVSFIDAYLVACYKQQNLEGIYSFDKDFDKIKSVKRFEPKLKESG